MNQNKALIFLLSAAVSGIAVYAEGNLAPANQAVKNFGDRMVRDHSKANDDLKNVASKKGVTLRDSMNASNKASMTDCRACRAMRSIKPTCAR